MVKYKTAKALGITPQERNALITTMQVLRGGKVEHVTGEDVEQTDSIIAPYKGGLGFSMAVPFGVLIDEPVERYNCNSAACIGGHMKLHMLGVNLWDATIKVTPEQDLKVTKYVQEREDHPTLGSLFFPGKEEPGPGWDNITPGGAADTIEEFLTTGIVNFKELSNGS